MDLLPKSHTEFSEKNYWEKFFKKWGPKAFEWYGEYPVLCSILHKYAKSSEKVLMVGCGNSALSADMYDVGYHQITNIDISDVVIRQMTEKHKEQRPKMTYQKMDMLNMNYSDGEFAVVLDKGTLDALMTDASEPVLERVRRMFAEVGRVLRVGGRYVCVSLAQEHILQEVTRYFAEEGWMVRVCRVGDADSEQGRDFHMPVFVFVCTKLARKMPMPILELSYFEEKAPERLGSVAALVAAVKQLQQYGLVRQQINKGSQDAQLSLDLFSAASTGPRYTLFVVDTPTKTTASAAPNAFAIFIVPEGRETEWMFSSDEGRKELAKNAGFRRLLVVTLHRNHSYACLEEVKAELSAKVMELAPHGVVGSGKQVPFLTVGDELCSRRERHRGTSELSGELVVEDVEVDGQVFRRLVFLASQNVVQSEARLINVRRKKGKKGAEEVVDRSHLGCNYYSVMLAGLALLPDFSRAMDSGPRLLMLGLGGGGLPIFIHHHYPTVVSEVVEIDEAVASVASEWFGLTPDDRLKVKVADGLQYVEELAKLGASEQQDVVIVDVDSKDLSAGMSCPPRAFVAPAFLKALKQVLKPTGVLMLNLVCRNQTLKEEVLTDLKAVFPTVYSKRLDEAVNEIVFALPEGWTKPDNMDKALSERLKTLQEAVRKRQGAVNRKNYFSLLDKLEDLTLL